MEIGIGLPSTIPGAEGDTVLEWASEADQAGFSSLASTDRLVYPGYEPLTALAAVAAVTARCRLTTSVLLAPLHTGTALLAKQTATVDRLSGGRLVLGIGVGGRRDDFTAAGAEYRRRGAVLEAQLDELERIWGGEPRGFAGPVGPPPCAAGGPEIILGGHSPAAVDRAARRAAGWISGASGPQLFAKGAAAVRDSWQRHGRTGRPRLLALCYFSLGPDAERSAEEYLLDYYGFAPPYAEMVLRAATVGEGQLRAAVQAFQDAGCDELLLMPCSGDLKQVELLSACVEVGAGSRPPGDSGLMTWGQPAGQAGPDSGEQGATREGRRGR
jgi:alkanesulfonate monooxygenase SsuD/methylene tetrahydromethanopterin reductase-like flavin-dependent oxidoreductase (luciferase family)